MKSPWPAIAVGVGVVALLIYARRSFDPSSDQNVIYRGVNQIGDIADDGTDNDTFSLGRWLYYWLNPQDAPNA